MTKAAFTIKNMSFLLVIVGVFFVLTISAEEIKPVPTKMQKLEAKKEQPIKKLTPLEEQQKILEQYKPLIKPREYSDLVVYREQAKPLTLNRLPKLEEKIIPGRAPNIRLIPYLRKSFAHPAYEAVLNGRKYLIAVNCNDPSGFDDCSTIPHNGFKGRVVYTRFVHSSDPGFSPVPGLRVGQTLAQVRSKIPTGALWHGGGECVETSSDWLACFDASDLKVGGGDLIMQPGGGAKLIRFLLIKGKAY